MAHLTLWSFVTFATLALLLLVSFAPSHLSVVASPLPEPQQRGGRRGPARGGAARQRGPPPARARGGAGGRGRQGGGAGRGRGRGAPPPPPPPPPADPAQIELAREQARQRAIDLALQRGIDPNNEGELAAIIDELIENVDNGFEV